MMVSGEELLCVLIDPPALFRRLRHGHSPGGAQPLHCRLRVNAIHHQQAGGNKTGTANSLAAMQDDIAPGLEFRVEVLQSL